MSVNFSVVIKNALAPSPTSWVSRCIRGSVHFLWKGTFLSFTSSAEDVADAWDQTQADLSQHIWESEPKDIIWGVSWVLEIKWYCHGVSRHHVTPSWWTRHRHGALALFANLHLLFSLNLYLDLFSHGSPGTSWIARWPNEPITGFVHPAFVLIDKRFNLV